MAKTLPVFDSLAQVESITLIASTGLFPPTDPFVTLRRQGAWYLDLAWIAQKFAVFDILPTHVRLNA